MMPTSEKLKKNQKNLLWVIFILSLGATVGSLYYGWFGDPVANIASGDLFNPQKGFPPCTLCWYARVFQYPILLLSGIGLYYNDKKVAIRYILPLAILGLVTNVYKWLLEQGFFIEGAVCDPNTVSCTVEYIDYFGFVTIPLMGASVLVIIIICAILINKANKK